jgi:hypothetical protein
MAGIGESWGASCRSPQKEVPSVALCRNRPAIPFAPSRTYLILQWPIPSEDAAERGTDDDVGAYERAIHTCYVTYFASCYSRSVVGGCRVRVLGNFAHGFFVAADHIVDHTVQEVAYAPFQFFFRVQLKGSFDEGVIAHELHQSFLNDEPCQNHFVEGNPFPEPLPPQRLTAPSQRLIQRSPQPVADVVQNLSSPLAELDSDSLLT